jgi:hypothetical protein
MMTLTPADAGESAAGTNAAMEAIVEGRLRLDDMVHLTKVGTPERVIVAQIRKSNVVFRLTGDQIIWLANQGVNGSIIKELQMTANCLP